MLMLTVSKGVWITLIAVLAILILFLLYLSFSLVIVWMLVKKMFRVRGTDPENPCYLRFEDYEDVLERSPYQTGYYGKAINGYIYQKKGLTDPKGFIILSHGFFGTHVQYLVDIAFLCEKGYQVLAYDQYGVGISEGKDQVSLSNGIYVCENVIADVEKRGINHGLEIYLYGHSWGAFCSLGALKKHPEIKKAVLRSGPLSQTTVMKDLMKQVNKPLYYILYPIFGFCLFLLLEHHYVISAKRGFKNRSTKCLVIHSKDDTMAVYDHSIAGYIERHPKANFELYSSDFGGHNTIITPEANDNYKNACAEYEKIDGENEEEKMRRREAFASSLDRISMYPYREDVTSKIEEFLRS